MTNSTLTSLESCHCLEAYGLDTYGPSSRGEKLTTVNMP